MNLEFPEDSDTSDEDYTPAGAANGDAPSEVDSDGEPEDPLSESEDVGGNRGTKRKKSKAKTKRRKKTKGKDESQETSTGSGSTDVSPEKKEISEEDKKKHADSLWASFKMDTGFKRKTANASEATKPVKEATPVKREQEKVKITEIFEFAGEEVKIEKEVTADSAEARLLSGGGGNSQPSGSIPAAKSRGLSGIGSVLNQLGRKKKISTLEKSKLDWNKFKKEEKIEEELEHYKKGKDGYLERQDFLQRADLRRFEIEKEVRTIERNKRMNNVQ